MRCMGGSFAGQSGAAKECSDYSTIVSPSLRESPAHMAKRALLSRHHAPVLRDEGGEDQRGRALQRGVFRYAALIPAFTCSRGVPRRAGAPHGHRVGGRG